MSATDTDSDFFDLAVAFSRRRTWPQLFLMVLGGCVALTGIASVAAHIVHQDEQLALPMGQAVGLYVIGSGMFAWGGARGDTGALPRWLLITVLSGSLFILLAFVAGLLPAMARKAMDRGLGSRKGSKSNLASMVIEQGEAEALVGSPAQPSTVSSPARSASAMWHGPTDEAGRSSMVTANVRRSASLAARVRTKDAKPPITRVPEVGDGAVMMRSGKDGEIVGVQAAQGDWVVAMSLHRGKSDVTPTLLRYVSRALERLAKALP
jgi:hypothetical protein